jgi:site-specific recombinase XerD
MNLITTIDKFCDYSKYMRGYSPDTIKRYRMTAQLLQRHIQAQGLEDCTNLKVREFFYHGRQERHWSANSFITYHKSLAVFFRWCVQQGYLQSNPTDEIEMPKTEKKLPPKLTKQEALRLLEIAHNYPYPYTFQRYRNYAIFATFVYAGLRKKELLHLQMVDVDLANQSIFIRQGKGSKDRVVPISSTLAGILQRYLEQRSRLNKTCPEFFTSLNRNMRFTESGMKRLVEFMKKASGICFGVHKLRHTFATLMLEGGCDIFSLSKMLGHSDIKTTTIYLAASPEHLRSQMLKHPLNDL